MNTSQWTTFLKNEATEAGFDQVAFCPAVTPLGLPHLHQWLDNGFHGEMDYLSKRRDAYAHPKHVLDGVKSIMMLATNYRSEPRNEAKTGQGNVSCYAWGSDDYHDMIHARFKHLKRVVHQQDPAVVLRGVVDTAPILEREFAQLAGLGWQGKNTLLISKEVGSYFFLSCILLDIELEYDQPFVTDHCGTCTACLDACPTNAFPQPKILDATRCISYLTIEHRSEIPTELRNPMGDWVFGCDICQDVCPWNRHAPIVEEQAFFPDKETNPIELMALFDMNEASFRARFRKTPLWRTRRRGVLRNAAIVLGNQQNRLAVPALSRGLIDEEPLVRGASAWALGEIASCDNSREDKREMECEHETKSLRQTVLDNLNAQSQLEAEPAVVSEIQNSISKIELC